jgi:hypothetical protein
MCSIAANDIEEVTRHVLIHVVHVDDVLTGFVKRNVEETKKGL